MKIIEPKVELWQQGDDSKAHVARCARVCYGRETGNDEATIKRLINDEHWSMFRHGTYYMIANDSDKTLETIIINYANTIGFSYGLLCNIVVLKVVKDEEMRNNK